MLFIKKKRGTLIKDYLGIKMDKYLFIKVSAVIFILLSVIISLFPPFEFGNEKLRTVSERRSNYTNKLPIKQYDFILGNNKKSFALRYHSFTEKFYDKNSLEDYKNLNSDNGFYFISSSADTFITVKKYLYKDTTSKENTTNKSNKTKYKFDFSKSSSYENPIFRQKAAQLLNPNQETRMAKSQNKWKFVFTGPPLEYDPNWIKEKHLEGKTKAQIDSLLYPNQETRTDAINYNEVKEDYNKEPDNWDFKYIDRIDSIKKYDEYKIAQPIYYLLERKILLGELLVEYILAFFISLVIGFLTERIPFLRKVCVDIMK